MFLLRCAGRMIPPLLALCLAPLAMASDPYPSTYNPVPSAAVLIHGAVVYTGDGRLIEDGYVLMSGGLVQDVGQGYPEVDDTVRVIDAAGKTVTPGLIDVHSHLGDYPAPGYQPHSAGNEMTSPVTSEVWAEHSVWPQDPQFPLALAGGVTTLQVLPGSANLFGGRSVTLKNVSATTVQGMKFPGAPYGLKMACGENPKRIYGEGMKRAPATRMGNFAGYRKAWIDAGEYRDKWADYEAALASYQQAIADPEEGEEVPDEPKPPKRDLQLETLVGVLDGEILVHNHCYRADEMALIVDLSKEFGYQVTAFHHAVESYKIAGLLAENGICSALWADWWRFKLEAFDGIEENIAIVHDAGACAIVHSDSALGIQRLNQEAAKALAAGLEMGLDISKPEAMTWLTQNAAGALGIGDVVGTLTPGKMADVVVWSHDPFSVYARAEKVYIDGHLVFDLARDLKPVTDYELGQRVTEW